MMSYDKFNSYWKITKIMKVAIGSNDYLLRTFWQRDEFSTKCQNYSLFCFFPKPTSAMNEINEL